MTDDDLMAAAAGGDRQAFAELYRRRRPDVYRFAVHMTGSLAVAEDVAQETFLTLITDASRYQPGRSSVVAWLLGIARNHARRKSAARPVEALMDDTATIQAAQADAVERDQELKALRRALCALPDVYREAVVCCDLQELSYADAAAAAGCAIGTIRSRLHRGRAMLAAAMKDARRPIAPWIAPTRVL